MTGIQDLSGQYPIPTRHCPLTSFYFKPCIDRTDDEQRDLTGEVAGDQVFNIQEIDNTDFFTSLLQQKRWILVD